ncbi:hypothetical protein HK104_006628 [Borealophlyctis nickersoniae]|nr:hypothetical protein HK104_006628 [Borealophlyctis nickersoniae]
MSNSKRPSSPTETHPEQPQKRNRADQPPSQDNTSTPKIWSSSTIEDRGSSFLALHAHTTSKADATGNILPLLKKQPALAGAAHLISAYRVLTPKPGRTGAASPDDFTIAQEWDDDGERWAGKAVMRVLEEKAELNSSPPPAPPTETYDSVPLGTAERLLKARDSTVATLRKLYEEAKQKREAEGRDN